MLKPILTATALSIALAAPAFASQCPSLMKDVDAALEANAPADEQTLQQVKDLRAEGEALHEAGQHDASVDTLQKALALIEENKG